MYSTHKKSVALLMAVVIGLISASEIMAQSADTVLLDREVKALDFKNELIHSVLEEVSSRNRIPIGVVRVTLKQTHDLELTNEPKISVKLKPTKLRTVLDTLVEKDPRYTWKLEDGVVHVFPVSERDALIDSLLDTRISYFGYSEEMRRHGIYKSIWDVPEIASQLIVADVYPLQLFMGPVRRNEGMGLRLDERNITLRALLDKILLKSDITQWSLTRWGARGRIVTLTLSDAVPEMIVDGVHLP
jgi:hypothetical protein